MTVSDSLPIQFWDADDSTFNETDVCGLVKQDCFCQVFSCDDSVTFQYSDSFEYALTAYNENDELIYSESFSAAKTGVWKVVFSPITYSPSLCDLRIRFKIELLNIFTNSTFDSSLVPWTNTVLAGRNPWAAIGGVASVSVAAFPAVSNSQLLYYAYSFQSGREYTVEFDVNATGFSVLTMATSNAPAIASSPIIQYTPVSSGHYSVTFTLGGNAAYILFYISLNSGPSSTITLDNIISVDNTSKKSDCVIFSSNTDCTKLITYTNSSNFDGLVYEGISPIPEFSLRIPATFYEESNPQEQEDLELSNGQIVTIRQGIQQKKKLDIGYMSPRMHLKVQKVLMHETVTIDGTQWRRRDPYNSPNIPKYNLKKGDVLLTKYNSVEKNTI